MARRMTLEGMQVKGVYEVMSSPGGLTRNIVQCLDDFNIPLHLSHTVIKVNGRKRVESVVVAKVDQERRPIPGTEEEIPCDLLVLAVGLIPENELSVRVGIEIDGNTKGPVLDSSFMTSVPGIFAAGNVAAVFDLVDYVSQSAEIAARGAVSYIRGELNASGWDPVSTGENVSFVVPQRIRREAVTGKRVFYLRVKHPEKAATLVCTGGEGLIYKKRCRHLAPPEMISFEAEAAGQLKVEMVKEAGK
jgi:NADPH-dependent 2,4-dienoyl-CoA reductase/sulfur reductase-like enzyme